MMPLVLLLIAWLLIFSEFFLPGGVMGTAGALILAVSVAVVAAGSWGPAGTLLFLIVALLGSYGVCQVALWRLKSAHAESGISSLGDEEGFQAAQFNQEMVGKRGSAATDLKPSGHVVVDGLRIQALSQSGYVDQGTEIEVIGGRGAYLLVKHVHGVRK